MDAAVGAFGQGLFDGLLDAFGAHGDGHDFAVVFFFQAQGLFEGVAIGFVGFKADVGFTDPGGGLDDGQGSVFCRNLFYEDGDFQDRLRWTSCRESPSGAAKAARPTLISRPSV